MEIPQGFKERLEKLAPTVGADGLEIKQVLDPKTRKWRTDEATVFVLFPAQHDDCLVRMHLSEALIEEIMACDATARWFVGSAKAEFERACEERYPTTDK